MAWFHQGFRTLTFTGQQREYWWLKYSASHSQTGHVIWKAQAWLVTLASRWNTETWRLRNGASSWTVWELNQKKKWRCYLVDMRCMRQNSLQCSRPDWQTGRKSHILTVNTNSFFCTAFEFWVRPSCASPCRICCQLFVYKKNIHYHDNDDDDKTNDDDDDYYYCISIVYVADAYWLFTTVEQNVYLETPGLCRVSIHIVYCITRQNTSMALESGMPFVRLSGGLWFDGYDLQGDEDDGKRLEKKHKKKSGKCHSLL